MNVDNLWFKSLDFQTIFTTRLSYQVRLGLIGFVAARIRCEVAVRRARIVRRNNGDLAAQGLDLRPVKRIRS